MNPETISMISTISLNEIGWRKKVYSLLFVDCLLKGPQTLENLKANCSNSLCSIFSQQDFDDSITFALPSFLS